MLGIVEAKRNLRLIREALRCGGSEAELEREYPNLVSESDPHRLYEQYLASHPSRSVGGSFGLPETDHNQHARRYDVYALCTGRKDLFELVVKATNDDNPVPDSEFALGFLRYQGSFTEAFQIKGNIINKLNDAGFAWAAKIMSDASMDSFNSPFAAKVDGPTTASVASGVDLGVALGGGAAQSAQPGRPGRPSKRKATIPATMSTKQSRASEASPASPASENSSGIKQARQNILNNHLCNTWK
jgi:hypothetical protein